MELCNVHPKAKDELYKMASVALCPNVDGQVMCDLMVAPPMPNEPSYNQYMSEKNKILASLKRRAQLVASSLNQLQGVRCNEAEGAMYLFPRITLPINALKAATAAGKNPDTYYCLEMLNATGLCVVPGSGFGQRDGTWHFRTTFLPPEDKVQGVLSRLADFHSGFMKQFS